MAFTSLSFILFFPVAALGYYVVPQKLKNSWLLMMSYYFYMCFDIVYSLFLLFSTLTTYFCGRLLERINASRARKMILIVTILLNLGLLFLFKYYNMFSALAVRVFALLGITLVPAQLSLLLPVGISFYTFQVLGYSIDVYRETVKAEQNFLDFALFVSFFPQLTSGPIGRADALLPQFHRERSFCYENVAEGLRIMLLGFFKKIVIADNIGIAVNRMFTYLDVFPGPVLLYGIVLYAMQVYCDFSGYSDIAVGAAKVMGFDLTRNFDHPYFSETISEFWRRWHISLCSWFRDYLFYPVLRSPLCISLTRRFSRAGHKQAARILPTAIAQMVVWFTTGLWHGAAWTYVAWGGLHGIYQIVGNITQSSRKRLAKKTGWDKVPRLSHPVKVICTFSLVCVGYVFFRSNSFDQAAYFFTHFYRGWGILIDLSATMSAFISLADSVYVTLIVLGSCFALWWLELYERRRGLRFERLVAQLSLPCQWFIYYLLLFSIALFGAFGQSSFIYFQF